MAIQPGQPQSIGEVLDTAFQLYKASVIKVWPICLLLVVVSSPPSVYMIVQGGANPADPLAAMAMMSNPTYWLIYAFSVILTLWAVAALYVQQHAIGTDENAGTGAALQTALGRTLPLVLMTILFAIAVAIGSILLLVPGLILMVSLMLGANLLIIEGRGPLASLKGSHSLVWGDWWRTAGILTIGFIVVLVVYSAAGLLVGIVVPFIGAADVLMFALVSGVLIGVVMNVLVTPFYVALLIAVYWDLKLRKEGGDLAARVGALTAA